MATPKTHLIHLALCRELAPAAAADVSAPPDWLLLVPAGDFAGRDGRSYRNPEPAAIVAAFAAAGTDIPFDIEHSTHHQAPQGLPAPAQAWVDRLEVRDGAVWGHVTWTPDGTALWVNRAYRYYSPAYWAGKDTGIVVGIPSVGLTNRPNIIDLPALNSWTPEATPVDLTEIATALGLDPAADLAAILAAIKAMQEAKREDAAPALNAYVPRADFDLLLNRVQAAEAQTVALRDAEHTKAVDAVITLALNSARITPGTEAYYRKQCATPAGLADFRGFLGAAVPVLGGGPRVDGAVRNALALNAQERDIAGKLGLTIEQYTAAKAAEQEAV